MKTNTEYTKPGSELCAEDRAYVLSAYIHRYTREHIPDWSRQPMPSGESYKLQFDSDADWLAHTRFVVTTKGRLNHAAHWCESNPTWPDNPELRTAQHATPTT